MNREFRRQLKLIEKQEDKILNKKENLLYKLKIDPIIEKIQGKIPEKLITTLEAAFYKGFQLVFEKGHVYIEKTYNKDKIQLEYDLNNYAIDKVLNKKYIKNLDKQANNSNMINSSFSIIEGGVLGALGIGLPDIPLFISVIMKTIYEVTLSYGYQYETEEEKAYILLLICGAMTKGDKQKEFNVKIDGFESNINDDRVTILNLKEQIKETASVLSEALLMAKFIQGIPIIGIIGGIVNYKIIKKIGSYARIKYKKRYLLSKVRENGNRKNEDI